MQVELITTLLERTIAYHPMFRDVAGSTVGGVFLSQVYYWSTGGRIPSQRAGWFYKTGKEWQLETRLTRSEQVRARRDLKKAGLLEEKLRGRPAKLFYRLNLNRLFECIMALVGPGGGSPSGGSSGGLAGNGGDNSVSFPPVIKDTDQGNTVGDIAADSALASAQAVKEKACENASLQDSASLKSDQEKVLKNSSLQDAAYSMSGLGLASGYQWYVGAENGLDNKALQSYPLSLGDSAFSLQNPAIKALNSANKSAESCKLYTKITTENTSEITADAERAGDSVSAGVPLGDRPESSAAHSQHPVGAVFQDQQEPKPSALQQGGGDLNPSQPESQPDHIQPDQGQPSTEQTHDVFQRDESTGSAFDRFPMSCDWQPDLDRLDRLCRIRGVSLKDLSPECYQDLISEFRTYRVSEGLALSQHKWEVKLVDQLLWYQRNRSEFSTGDGVSGFSQASHAHPSNHSQQANRESRYARSSSSAGGRSKPRNAAERLAVSCAGAFDYFQSGDQSQSQARNYGPHTGAYTGASPGGSLEASPETGRGSAQGQGAIQSAASNPATGGSDAGFSIGQSVAAGEVSRAEGGEIRVIESCSSQARSGEASSAGWRDEASGVLGGGVVNPPPTSVGDIWDNPSMWPVS